LPPAKIDQIVEQMIGQWDVFLRQIEGCLTEDALANGEPLSPGTRFVAGFGEAVIGAARRYVAENTPRLTADLKKGGASAEAAD